MSNEAIIRSLVEGTEFDDPRLHDLLSKMIDDLYNVYYQLNPPVGARTLGVTGSLSGVNLVTGFSAVVNPTNIHLSWSTLSGAVSYEIRYQSGLSTDWASARSLLTTTTLTADINPVTLPLVYGNHTFLIKATNLAGTESGTASTVTINLATIPAPSITPTVIDNFVLLKWTIPASTLLIAYYNVYKNNVLIGKMDGTFEAIFETVSGTFTYKVETVDIVGNVGTSTSVSVTVNQPPDYEIQDIRTSTLNGTRSYVALEGTHLTAIVDTCGI